MTGFFIRIYQFVVLERFGTKRLEPRVWRKAGRLYIRQYQKNLTALAYMLSEQLRQEVMVTFDHKEQSAVLYTDDERLALIKVLQQKDKPETRTVAVRCNLNGCKLLFQFAFLKLRLDWQPFSETLLLTQVVPRER